MSNSDLLTADETQVEERPLTTWCLFRQTYSQWHWARYDRVRNVYRTRCGWATQWKPMQSQDETPEDTGKICARCLKWKGLV